jgi:hypothetical protein
MALGSQKTSMARSCIGLKICHRGTTENPAAQLVISRQAKAKLLSARPQANVVRPPLANKAALTTSSDALRQIVENAGEDCAVIAGKILDRDEYNWGFDAQTGEFKGSVKAGIVDPTKVVRTAMQDVASVADYW